MMLLNSSDTFEDEDIKVVANTHLSVFKNN